MRYSGWDALILATALLSAAAVLFFSGGIAAPVPEASALSAAGWLPP